MKQKPFVMKTFAIIQILFCICFAGVAQDFDWAEKAGGNESDQGYDIVTSADGISYVTGWFSDTAHFDDLMLISAGGKDVFVAKYGIGGDLLWVCHAPGEYSNTAAGITTDQDGNVFITGWFEGQIHFGDLTLQAHGLYDMFVAKLNPQGDFIWANQSYGEQDNYGNRLCINPEGDVIVAGSFRHVVDFGNEIELESEGDRDIFIALYSNEGDIQWVKRFGGTGEDRAYGIETDQNGHIFFTGFFNGTVFFKELSMYSPAIASAYVARLSPGGGFTWAHRLFGGANDLARGFGLDLDEAGNAYTTGFFSGMLNLSYQDTLYAKGGKYDLDVYVAKYDPDGTLLWAQNAGGVHMDQGRDLVVDPAGNSYISGFINTFAEFGSFEIESTGMSDVFAAKYDTDGNIQWLINAGGTLADYGFGIGIDADSAAYLTGAFTEDATFGDITLEGWNLQDIFVARIDPTGSFISLWQDRQEFRIYPNPVDEEFRIDLDQEDFNAAGTEINIFDMNGRIVYQENLQLSSRLQEHTIHTAQFHEGVYVMKIVSSSLKRSVKFVVKHH